MGLTFCCSLLCFSTLIAEISVEEIFTFLEKFFHELKEKCFSQELVFAVTF